MKIIVAVVVLFGYLNKWNDSIGTEIEGAVESGEKYLKSKDWKPIKHGYIK